MTHRYDRDRSFTLGDRFRYWFDNRMTKGSLGFIRVLIAASVLLALVVAGLIVLLGFNGEDGAPSVFWNSISTVINAWMPSYEDGSVGYVILMSVVAIAGVLFTSVLIGVITSAIEEKITSLKKGNSIVLERGHIVLLGFNPGEFTLLRQLILAAAGRPTCIAIGEDMDREDMEQAIRENLEVPKGLRIVCRTVDITDPASIEKLSVETCGTVIISPTDDMKTTKAVLAVSALLEEKGVPEISVNAIISKNEYRFPPSLVETNNLTTFRTGSVMAKMIAHSCTQTGLSEAFREIFNFEGSEFYLTDIPGCGGMSFMELTSRLDRAAPVGFFRDGKIVMDPPADEKLLETDRILVFSENSDSAELRDGAYAPPQEVRGVSSGPEETTETVIIGYNETLPIILRELPKNVSRVYLVAQETTGEEDELRRAADERGIALEHVHENVHTEKGLLKVAHMAEHIVVLGQHDREYEDADMNVIFLLLNLRDIRDRYGLDFNITVEMQKEHNQKLVGGTDHTDFLVSSSMSSLILAQLAENPDLIGVFREILSNRGNELYLKNAARMRLTGKYSVRQIRQVMLQHGYILLGYLDAGKAARFDLMLDDEIALAEEDDLIVLGEN